MPSPSVELVRRAEDWRAGRMARQQANNERALALVETATTTTVPEVVETVAPPTTVAAPEPVPTTAAPPPPTAPPPPPPTTAPPPPPTTTTAPAPPPEPPPGQPGEPTPAQWAALRSCESGGNYGAINPTGEYRGAYQFSQATWDWVAGTHFANLVGVDPAAAAPGDQDAMALALWRMRGSSPWPSCGYHLN